MHETTETAVSPAQAGGLSRRHFLSRSLLIGMGIASTPVLAALTACSPTVIGPDDQLLAILGQLRSLGATAGENSTGMFSTQAQRLTAEALRQCGESPEESCTTSVANAPQPPAAPAVADVRRQIASYLPDAADGDQASLLTGITAALSTLDDKVAGGAAIDWGVVSASLGEEDSSRRKKAVAALATATSRIHEAIWLTGRIQPSASGAAAAATAITTVADRLRRVREAAVTVSGVAAAPGYVFPPGTAEPTDATGALTILLNAVHAVTVETRRAVSAVATEDRTIVAMWCAVSARCEAALEDALGHSPEGVAVRGE